MTVGVACGRLAAMIARQHDTDAPSLGLVLVDALVFWLRHQGVFWLMALPIAGLAAAITYVLETNQALVDWRHHWGWGFQGGFKWSSQHGLCWQTKASGQASLRAFSSQASFGAGN